MGPQTRNGTNPGGSAGISFFSFSFSDSCGRACFASLGGESSSGGDGMGVSEGNCEICECGKQMLPFPRAASQWHGKLALRCPTDGRLALRLLWWSLDWHLSGSEAEGGLIGIFV